MNAIQKLCTSLSMMPVNGLADNEFDSAVTDLCADGVEKYSAWALFSAFDKVVLETNHQQTDIESFQRNTIKSVSFFSDDIREPLVLDLMPAHPVAPRFPGQLFNQKDGVLEVKPNPFTGSDFDKTFSFVFALYVGMHRLIGFGKASPDSPNIIEQIILDIPCEEVTIRYAQQITEEVFKDIEAQIKQEFGQRQEEMLNHFVLNFMSGMTHKSKHGFKEIDVDGKAALQNCFEPVEWPDTDKAKSIQEHLFELSFDSLEGCPAYIDHMTRLRVYIKELMPKFISVEFPMTVKDWGMDCETWDDFFKSESGERMIDIYKETLFEFLEDSGMTLGSLLDQFEGLKSKAIN